MTMQPVRPRRVWDLVLTIIFLVLHVAVAALAAFSAIFLAFGSDSCGASSVCDTDRIAVGMMAGFAAPLVVGFITLIATIVSLVRRRLSFWIPLVGTLLAIGVEVAAWAYGLSGVVPMNL